jgi:hypothetical protein
MRLDPRPLLPCAALALLAIRLPAQCTLTLASGDPIGSPAGSVAAIQVFDPDGNGPAPDLLVAGGRFAVGASVDITVGAYDGSEWRALAPSGGTCTALGLFGGRLVAAISQSTTASDLRTFDGTTWRSIGAVRGVVHAMTQFQGSLILGGNFSHVDNLPASSIAAWNGTAWSALGVNAGGVSGTVRALATFVGALYVGGDITSASGVPAGNLATWNGTAWAAGPVCNRTVRAMAVRNGTSASGSFLFVGGAFSTVGPIAAQGVASYNPLNGWSAMGPGILGGCSSLLVRHISSVAFELNAGASGGPIVARWNGSAWITVGFGAPAGPGAALTMFRGRYVVATAPTHGSVRALATTGAWLPVSGTGIDGPVLAVHATPTDVVIGGGFSSISGVLMNGIARGAPGAWQPLGGGVNNGRVHAIATMPGGDIIAAGSFSSAGGVAASGIARWDGSSWSPLGSGITGTVKVLAVLPDGSLVAGGSFLQAGGQTASNIARWNGSTWSPLGPGLDGAVDALAVAGDGLLIAAGDFRHSTLPPRRIARWSGSSWFDFPHFDDAVTALATLTNGDVLIGGAFAHIGTQPVNHLARWNGRSLSAVAGYNLIAGGRITTIVPLAGQQAILAAGQHGPSPGLARFDGSVVVPTGSLATGFVAGAQAPDGAVVLATDATFTGTSPRAFTARLVTSCPASAQPYGSGCRGSGGDNVLRARTLPWLGAPFSGEATGMPALGLALGITGFAAVSIPIASLLRRGAPGCNLLATLDLVELVTPQLGQAHTTLPLPLVPALAGQVLRHQVVALEVSGSNLVAATSSNGLRLTLGMF